MPTVRKNHFLLRNILRVGITKSRVLVIIFRVFMCPLSLKNKGLRSIIDLQCFEMALKKTRSSYKGTIKYGTPLSYYDYEMASKERKNRCSTFERNEYELLFFLKLRTMHCLIIGQKDLPFY